MYFSGPSAYYSEYMRKGRGGGTLHDPPSLLTDRGAYVNFLEVQLERVSAACLGVSAYDDRFTDMQRLVVGQEERLQHNTKLLGLSQAAAEEANRDTLAKLEGFRESVDERLTGLQSDVDGAFRDLAAVRGSLAEVLARLVALEVTGARSEERLVAVEERTEHELGALGQETGELRSSVQALHAGLEATRTDVSKGAFAAEELAGKTRARIEGVERAGVAAIDAAKQDLLRAMEAADVRHSSEVSRLHAEVLAREGAVMTAVRMRREHEDDDVKLAVDAASKRLGSVLREEMAATQSFLLGRADGIEGRLDAWLNRHEEVEHSIVDHLDAFDHRVASLSSELSAQRESLEHTASLVEQRSGRAASLHQDLRALVAKQRASTSRLAQGRRKRPVVVARAPEVRNWFYDAELQPQSRKIEVLASKPGDGEDVPKTDGLGAFVERYERDNAALRGSIEALSSALLSDSKLVLLSSQNTPRNSPAGTPTVAARKIVAKSKGAREGGEEKADPRDADLKAVEAPRSSSRPRRTAPLAQAAAAAAASQSKTSQKPEQPGELALSGGMRAPWLPARVRSVLPSTSRLVTHARRTCLCAPEASPQRRPRGARRTATS